MKKKLLFMVINMNVGGTEKALLNMITEIPEDQYDITILMLEESGGFLNAIPDHVQIEYVKEYGKIKEVLNNPPKKTALNLLKRGRFLKAINLLSLHVASKIMKDRSIFYKQLLKDIPELITEYDVAIAYAGPMDFISFFVAQKIKATKKIQWIHFDITKIGFNKKIASKIYGEFDKIFVVSEEARKKLISVIPRIKRKTEVFLNVISPSEIHSQSREGNGFDDEFDGLRILTVGRLATEKGQDLAIGALKRLIQKGYKVRWYCIGDGNSREWYEELIKEHDLHKDFILLGSNSNPYPYMNQCDIYVQPSRYEGYCITLIEARFLNKPIVTTNVNGAKEQIINGENGLIVDISEEAIFNAVEELIKGENIRAKFISYLSNESINPETEIKKLLSIV